MNIVEAWPTFLITASLLAGIFLANELGYRRGRTERLPEPESSRSVSNGLKASVFGLVGFLLAFTFSITVNRHDSRRRVVLDEANAIGTCYLRAGLLPSPFDTRIQRTLRELTATRLRFFNVALDETKAKSAARQMDSQLATLWKAVEEATKADGQVVHHSHIIPAANTVIDLDTTRDWAAAGRLPRSVLVLLIVCVFVSNLLIGHSSGQVRRRHTGLWTAFNVLFALVLFVVLDFDRPRRGLILLDHQPLIELQESISQNVDTETTVP